MRILGVIPARAGSKRVSNKNIRPLGGIPLIACTIRAARAARFPIDLIVSTESAEIAKIAREHGAEVPFMRPPELATDTALTYPVVEHALTEMEKRGGQPYDLIMLLQPTTPFRSAATIDSAIDKLQSAPAHIDGLITVCDVKGMHPFRMKTMKSGMLANYVDQGFEDMRPLQVLPKVYIRSGAIYLIKRNAMLEQRSLVGKNTLGQVVSDDEALNIDDENDWLFAEFLLARARKTDAA